MKLTIVIIAFLLSSITECSVDKSYLKRFEQHEESSDISTSVTDDAESEVDTFSSSSRHYLAPNDQYRCAERCRCYKGRNNTQKIYANCSPTSKSQNKNPIFPLNLPIFVSELDLSRNYVESFQSDQLASFASLEKVKAQSCHIKTINLHGCTQRLNIIHLDLSKNMITIMNNYSLSCLNNLKELLLLDNQLVTINVDAFAGLSNLVVLDLSNNYLSRIQTGAFANIPTLIKLDLSNNKNIPISNRSASLFEPLGNLQTLHIHKTKYVEYYPVKALQTLKSVSEISLNGEKGGHFVQELSELEYLTNVAIAGYCLTQNFTRSYFSGLPRLKSIRISNCKIVYVSPLVFDNNDQLEQVEISSNYLTPLETAFDFVCALQNHSVVNLSISGHDKNSNLDPGIVLDETFIKCLSKLSHLRDLNLDSNDIVSFSRKFIDGLPKSLRVLSVKNNLISYKKSVLNFMLFYHEGTLPNLTFVYEDNQGLSRKSRIISEPNLTGSRFMPQYYMELNSLSKMTYTGEDQGNVLLRDQAYESKHERVLKTNSIKYKTKKANCCPSMQEYSASFSYSFGDRLFDYNLQGFRFLNLSSTFLTKWGHHENIKHMPDGVEVADLSENRCRYFRAKFFKYSKNLIDLRAQGNYLGPLLSKDIKGTGFSRLKHLQYLDLSRNYVAHLPWQVFRHNDKLQVLRLSMNNLVQLDIQLAHMTSLVYLDLKKNSLRDISERTRNDLDRLAEVHKVTIDLQENPILCSCQGLEFLRWMRDTKVTILNIDFLTCETVIGHYEELGDLDTRIASLKGECVSKKILVVSCTFVGTSFIFVLITVWVFTNRWKIIYWHNFFISYFFGYKPTGEDKDNSSPYSFDAFFVYAPTSRGFVFDDALKELETKRGHRLCVDDRDFLPGSFIPCNITSAVRSSGTTVVVVDQTFKPEGWSHYAVEMAQVEAVRSKRDVLHLLLLDSLPEERLPNAYLKAAKDGRVSEMPPVATCDPDATTVFWDTLSRTIGHCGENLCDERSFLQLID